MPNVYINPNLLPTVSNALREHADALDADVKKLEEGASDIDSPRLKSMAEDFKTRAAALRKLMEDVDNTGGD
jgi:hypothetical protein